MIKLTWTGPTVQCWKSSDSVSDVPSLLQIYVTKVLRMFLCDDCDINFYPPVVQMFENPLLYIVAIG